MCNRAVSSYTSQCLPGNGLHAAGLPLYAAGLEAILTKEALERAKPDTIWDALRARNTLEPPTGIVDAVLVAPVEDVTGKGLPQTYLFIKHSPLKGESQTRSSAGTVTGQKVAVHNPNFLSNPFQTTCTETTMSEASPIYFTPQFPIHHEHELRLPVVLVEYKKPDDLPAKALNQCRMYCVSAASYLATLGIKEHPVFGFATSGQVGFMIMVWHSAGREVCFTLHFLYCG